MIIVYKTTNVVNEDYYIGVHRTKDLEDKYLGSGIRLQYSVKKYGKENFRKEILFIFDNDKEAFEKERELVAIHKQDPKCMNIADGGLGGYGVGGMLGKLHTSETKQKMSKAHKGRPKRSLKLKEAARNNGLKALKVTANPIIIDNVHYISLRDAQRKLNISRHAVKREAGLIKVTRRRIMK